MTPVFCCGFECGATGTVGQHWNVSNASISTSIVRSGLRAGRVNPAGSGGYFITQAALGGTLTVARAYIKVASAPTTDAFIFGVDDALQSSMVGLGYKTSDGKYYAIHGTGGGAGTMSFGATGVTLDSNWHYVDIRVNMIANPFVIEVSVDGVALGTLNQAVAASTIRKLYCGSLFTSTYDIYFDDVIQSATSADYPIGPGKVLGFVPNADGTHTATTTTIVKGTAAAPTAGGNVAGATDVFNWVDARPIGGGATDATRLVNQQTAASTLYAEVAFENTVEVNPPRAVEVLCADKQASTAVGDMETRLIDGGSSTNVIFRFGTAGVVTDRFTTKQFPTRIAGAAWTTTDFNALTMRFGYSGDATPDQYWRGAMVEAEFPIPILNKTLQLRQSVKRASTY